MAVNKQHREFYQVDIETGWESPKGYPAGVQQKILSGTIDLARKTGGITRLLRFLPGAFTTEPFIHDHWEEVFVVKGDLWVGNDKEGKGGEKFVAHTYCVRPPGVWHGPFRSEEGCLLVEMHYYDPQ